MLRDLAPSPTGAILTSSSKTQSLCPLALVSERLIRGPVSASLSIRAEYTFALRRVGADSDSVSSTPSAIRSMNSSSGRLAMVPPFSKLRSGTCQQPFDRLFRFARFECHLTSRGLFPVAPYQRQTILFRETSHDPPRILSQFILLEELMEVRNGCRRTGILIRIFNGFRGPQPSAIVVFHLVPCNSHDPGLQRAGSSIVVEALPCSQKDFLD